MLKAYIEDSTFLHGRVIAWVYLTGWTFLNVADYFLSGQVNQNIRTDIIQSHIIPIKRYHTQIRDYRAATWRHTQTQSNIKIQLGV